MDEVNELDARIARLPDDARWELARRVLRRLGRPPANDPEWAAAVEADFLALRGWEREHGKMFPAGAYRAAG